MKRRKVQVNENIQQGLNAEHLQSARQILLTNINDQLMPMFPGGINQFKIPIVYQHIWSLDVRAKIGSERLLQLSALDTITVHQDVEHNEKVIRIRSLIKKPPLVDFVGQFCPMVK